MQQQSQFYPQNGFPQQGTVQGAPAQQPVPGMARPPMRPTMAMPGIDPRQQAQARQSLAQPNQGDGFNRNTGRPPVQGQPVNHPIQNPALNRAGIPAQQAANQNLPGQGPDGQQTENPLEDLVPPPMEMLKGGALGVGLGLGMNEVMKNNRLINVAAHLDGIPGISHLSGFIENKILPRIKGDEYFLRPIYRDGKTAVEAVRLMQQNHIDEAFANFEKRLPGFASKFPSLKNISTFEALIKESDKLLEGGLKGKEAKVLTNFRQYMKSNHNYLSLFESKANLAQQLHLNSPKVGPIGRAFANGVNYIHRIFGGQAVMENMGMKTGAAKATDSGIFGKILGPFMMGFLMCGTAFNKARKAEKGEKIKTFFHEFLGAGLGNFIGWEIGVSLLKSYKVMDKLLGRFVGLQPLRWIPLIGRFTLGGALTQLVAMFIIAVPFQKAFEALSNSLFGKLKEKPKAPPQMPPGQLNRTGFEKFKRTPGQQKAVNDNAQTFSLKPEEISLSQAQVRHDEVSNNVMSQPWDLGKTFDPFTGSH